MKIPLLTVITPVYNGKRFIESCLQSVIAQNCPETEHLIMDGGSTDGTVEIIKRYTERHPHIRWISEKDLGQSDAMNKGIAMARGKIIGFLNFDDYYEPAVLPRVLKIFETMPNPSLVVGNCHILNDDEKITYVNKPCRLSFTNILIGGQKNQFPYNPSAYFYHKSLHEKIGLYDVDDHYAMDLDFLLRAVKAAHIQYVDETWGNFRHIKGTKTFQSRENDQLDRNKMRVMNAYFKKLPWFQRWWIKTIRFFLINQRRHYYAGRILDCLKNPLEITAIILRRLERIPKGAYREQWDFDRLGRKPPELLWKVCSRCRVKRVEAGGVQLGPELFVIGGYQTLDCVLNDVDVLDLKKGKWTARFKMPQTHTGIIGDGERYIYCVAGQRGPYCSPAAPDCFVLDT